MRVLENIDPKRVMFYFEELTRIPRESGSEKKVSDYLVNFAKNQGLDVIQDKALNVIIKKPASKGYENHDAIILQGHMDMVCAKGKNSNFDFDNDSLKIFIDGDFIKAKETTLGADNGVAVAMSLALLEDKNAIHPPVEILFTTEEETGMGGASNVDGSLFSGKTLINIDSEEEGEFCVSCAGGIRVKFIQPFELVKNTFKKSYELEISNLMGGHSGIEIDKGRANAIKLLGRVLSRLEKSISVTKLEGGEKMNAIAKRAKAIISSNIDLTSEIQELKEQFRTEFRKTDQNLEISISEIKKEEYMMDTTSQFKLINTIL
ncbi:MAG: beta-Ala-His dipeptidase, partial [Clostridiales bacterium]|nr:beta-Ala-His dipeptidase [Clostridiales bacterium]